MPLIKLWNTIRGKSDPKTPKNTAKPAKAAKSSKTRRQPQAKQPAAKKPSAPARPKLSLLDRFGGGPHAATCRLVKSSGATSVLEIGVGDGQRALAMTTALVDANPGRTVQYVAIDMFEMAAGPITLKDFHKQLRAQNVQPTLVPMDVRGGLNRVSSTIGAVDLILIAQPNEPIELSKIHSLLQKIASDRTSVHQLTGEQWQKVDLNDPLPNAVPAARRAA